MNAAVWIFLQACVCGAVSGAVYEFFRLFRLIFPPGRLAAFWQDGLYTVGIAVWIFCFTLRLTSGRLRFFVLVGWGLGFLLWYCTAGAAVYGFFRRTAALMRQTVTRMGQFLVRIFRHFRAKDALPLGHSD